MSYIAICDYENYYNRRCLPPQDTFQDYDNYIIDIFEEINFKINDGINTEQVINWKQPSWAFPNYLLVSDDGNTVKSRWYVLESQQTRSGQLRLTLRRDLIADFYEEATTAPAMIERGIVDGTSPFVLNDEGITFNQVKTQEYLLKDQTKTPWIVGYVARPKDDNEPTIQIIDPDSQLEVDQTINQSLASWYYTNTKFCSSSNTKIKYTISTQKYPVGSTYDYVIDSNSGDVSYSVSASYTGDRLQFDVEPEILKTNMEASFEDVNLDTVVINYSSQIWADDDIRISDANLNYIQNLDGKIIQFTDGIYKMQLRRLSGADFPQTAITNSNASLVFSTLSNFALGIDGMLGTPSEKSFSVSAISSGWYLEGIAVSSYNGTITDKRRVLSDAPYSMFAIPYESINIITENSTFATALGSATLIASEMANKYVVGTNGNMYDIQLLPYFPIQNIITSSGIDIRSLVEDVDYTLIQDGGGNNKNIIFWCPISEFTFDISAAGFNGNFLGYINRLKKNPEYAEKINKHLTKIVNQCMNFRLCSPNYASIFDFNIAKNGGLNLFNVDCAYKPYTPYIHINPDWDRLYGKDFNDPRGLICGGDFSMPATQDQWQLYEINNKNYNNIFERQIQTLELTHNVQREQERWQMVMGAIQSGVSAAQTGAYVGQLGGPAAMGISAGVAGAAGLGLSLAAGARDMQLQESLRRNELGQAQDMFRMSNENIQAMPDTLTKVSAFNPNNKIFPLLEFYTCTDEEIYNFLDYIQYNSMRIGKIGKVSNFINENLQFIQARIIRFDTLHDDAHVANEINNELMRGVYMKQ